MGSTQKPKSAGEISERLAKKEYKSTLRALRVELVKLQRHFIECDDKILVLIEGRDAAGKDGVIKHVMSGVNPQGCKVVTFKTPSVEELKHDFLWRVHQKAPEKGQIGIFNRSHYEDVLITRVHGLISDKVVRQRFNQINEFEELLSESGTCILKFFLHISKDEQKKRLEERIRNPEKRWKFSAGDIEERKFWKDYMEAFEAMLSATSTDLAPWHIVPADYKWYRNLIIAQQVVNALENMKLKTPPAPVGINFDTLKIE